MRSLRLAVAAAAAAFSFSSIAAQLVDPPSQAKSSATAGGKRDRGVVRTRVAIPNLAALHEVRNALRAQPGAAQEIELPVFEDRPLVLSITRIEELHGTTNYYGTVGGDPLSSVTITESRGSVAIHAAVGGKAWQVTLRGNHYEASEIDLSSFPGADEPFVADPDLPAEPKADVTAAADDGSTVDVMVVYTPTSRSAAGGTAAIENQIALAIASANQAYASTGVVQRLRLVHAVEVGYAEGSPTNMDTALRAITNGTSPFGSVGSLRIQYGADLVSLWIENGGNWCGLGWVMSSNSTSFAPYGFNVVDRGCATSNSSFAHELGHNMGLTHDAYQISKSGDTTSPAQPYGHGYVSVPGRFRTVMAYDTQCFDSGVSCARLNSFSTPLYSYNSTPIGNSSTADSTRLLDLTRTSVANFKARTMDVAPTIALAQAAYTVAEGAGNVTLAVTRSGSTTGISTVTWATANGTAVSGQDYQTSSGSITFAAGETSKTITIPILQDGTIEPNEAFTVTLSNPSNAVLGSTPYSTVTIASDDSSFALGATALAVAENATQATLRVTRTGSLTAPANVSFTTSNGTAIAGTDFGTAGSTAQVTGTLAFAANQAYRDIYIGATTTATPYIRIINDSLSEPAKTFNVTLSSPTAGAVLGANTQAVVTINSEDATTSAGPNTLGFAAATAIATEGSPSITLPVSRSGSTAGTASVSWSVANGTAQAGTDFGTAGNSTAPSGTLTWAAGDAATKAIVIPLLNDTVAESAQGFTVSLSSPVGTGVSIGTISSVNVTINDNDNGVGFAQASYPVNEGTASVSLTVMRSGSAATTVSVGWTTADGTATAGQDFGTSGSALQRSGTITWRAGDAAPKTIVIPVINDTLAEGAESFTVTLRTPSGVQIGNGVATVTIADNDQPPGSELRFGSRKYFATESAGDVAVVVTRVDLGGGFNTTASVRYATQAGTALATSDFTARSGTLTWAPGDSSPKTIVVPIVNNNVAEPDEVFKVVLSTPSAGTGIGTPTTTVTILDDDEVFPPQGAISWSTPAGTSLGWHVSSDPGAYEGALSLRSDAIDDSQTAGIEFAAGNRPAGTVAFRVKVSSEADFDFLRFYVDGVEVASWSGTSVPGWQAFSYPVPAGAHTFKWTYEKDDSVAMGQDAAWIDAVVLP